MRYEVKYFVSPEQYEAIKTELAKRMDPDKYCKNTGSYMIYNVYFDTDDDEIIRQSLEKPYYKEKLRMRSYKMPTSGDDTVFLELKKKIGGIVAKRRAKLTYAQALSFIECGAVSDLESYQDGQVLSEISEFLGRYPAKPKVFLSYERCAFFDRDDPDLRVSFDRNILARRDRPDLTSGDYGAELLMNDGILMEIKCSGQIPIWICKMLSEMKLYTTSFSKYGTEYRNYMACRQAARKSA
jgi:SPX domain protein involved in polyphosphate accumulation